MPFVLDYAILVADSIMTSRDKPQPKVIKSDEEWRQLLTPIQYQITRQHGTEWAFSSPDFDVGKEGVFACVCCLCSLFHVKDKYESGTGWPSFTRPIKTQALALYADHSYDMVRMEVRCADCDAHLGHVFPDGPPPTGTRYCINGHALTYIADTCTTDTGIEHAAR